MQDKDIVALYWERNEQAVKETEVAYGRYLLKIAYNILSNTEDSKEAVNDTYVKAWHSMPPQKPMVLSTYLGKLTRETSIDRVRSRTRQKRGGSQYLLSLEELGDFAKDDDTVAETAELRAVAETIGAFLQTLPPITRHIFVGRYFFLDSVREIARYCGVSEAKVKTDLHRTRTALKTHLEKEGLL